MCHCEENQYFIDMGAPRQVWAISAIHGDAERLHTLHDALFDRVQPGDRVIYLGNYTGYGPASKIAIDEILSFRRALLSRPAMKASDLIYLRGGQEEMWEKLLQIQFCPTPVDTLLWMLGNGMGTSMESYGICPHDGIHAAREGTMSLIKWTTRIRENLRRCPGHEIFMTQFKRAAYTQYGHCYATLFVNAGLDVTKSLEQQGDNFWWHGDSFTSIDNAYSPFEKVIRGYDPKHEGVQLNCVTASLDGGCGFGGTLVCAGMESNGDIFELIEA